jgi:hypothetical protein
MADTAAFFANKKKKSKKGFKSFNANKIDVSSVIPTTHVDAPEVSSDYQLSSNTIDAKTAVDDGWSDAVTAWGGNTTNTAAVNNGVEKVAELLDMQSIKDVDVAEKLRIEETKAQLARAKEGMAKEAERLEREKKEKEEKKTSALQANAAAADSGGKWIPSHLRGSSIRGPAVMGSGITNKPNVSDSELFPDLADAENILKEKEAKEKAEKNKSTGGIRAPSGWGTRQPLNLASRGEVAAPVAVERKPLNLAPPSKKKEEEAVVEKTVEKEEEEKEVDAAPSPAAVAATEESTSAAAVVVEEPKKDVKLKKKKKKDLSSFKPSG